jgi:hypothetical protein
LKDRLGRRKAAEEVPSYGGHSYFFIEWAVGKRHLRVLLRLLFQHFFMPTFRPISFIDRYNKYKLLMRSSLSHEEGVGQTKSRRKGLIFL